MRSNCRRFLGVAWTLIPLALGGLFCGGERGEQGAEGELYDTGQEIIGDPDAEVAVVAGEPIRLTEIDLVATFWSQSGAPQAREAENRKALQQAALDHLIDQLVLAQEARSRGITAPDSVVQQMIDRWEAQFESPADRDERLASRGVTVEQVRTKFAQDILVQQLVAETVRDTLTVTPAQIEAYYHEHPEFFETTEVHARHVLVTVDPGAPPESLALARERIESVHAQAAAGGEFERLAREFSDCPSRSQGGDLGYFRRGQMVKPFADAAFNMQPGEISEIVETQFGYHVIKVEDRRNEGVQALSEATPGIERFLYGQRLQEAVDAYADDLRAQREVEIKLPL
jgi:peptidyl-prolyl cis-trans isomerase C